MDKSAAPASSDIASLLARVEITVRPLDWSESAPPDDICSYDHTRAETPFGPYQIEWKSWKDYPSFSVEGPAYFFSSDNTLASAKATAATDFEARVLSALSTKLSEAGK